MYRQQGDLPSGYLIWTLTFAYDSLNQHPVFLETQFHDAIRKNSLKRKYTINKWNKKVTFLPRVDDVITMIFVLDQSKEILEKSLHIKWLRTKKENNIMISTPRPLRATTF